LRSAFSVLFKASSLSTITVGRDINAAEKVLNSVIKGL
jgi:hypothetical protein